MSNSEYSNVVSTMLLDASIKSRVSTEPAVILERVARGAGTTNWFVCSNQKTIEEIIKRLLPGSVVSFYFDNRIKCASYSVNVRQEIEQIIASTGDCVVGIIDEDGITLRVDFVADRAEIAEFESNLRMPTDIYYGPFPARDNNGKSAITVILPDEDGIVRRHPH